MKAKKIIWIVIGCLSVGVGAIGAVLPLLPSFPFLLLAAFSFTRSSEKLNTWFINTNLYKKNLESYVKGKGMPKAAKIRVMITVTILMAFSCGIMLYKSVYIPCIILGCVWMFHIFYFVFGVKTNNEESE